jgi:hypothetical protein
MNNLNNKEIIDKLKLSDKTKEALKVDFEGVTGKLEIDLNQGGVRDATVKVKVK